MSGTTGSGQGGRRGGGCLMRGWRCRDAGARTAWVAFGANLGNTRQAWERVLRAVSCSGSSRLIAASALYRTEPLGPIAQPWFTNAVFAVITRLEPLALFRFLRRLEWRLGRRRGWERPWGPRRVDLDLLFHGRRIIANPRLSLPHPRLHERRFVLRPLADLAPDLQHPILCETVDRLLKKVNDPLRVERLSRVAPTPCRWGAVTGMARRPPTDAVRRRLGSGKTARRRPVRRGCG
ncbi:MAG: 2-amino-4-hydroxy-6-hydroxymethyldihydropteridine diphosphokinase [Magnetococcales bacterium]|nr:2-amino-4-hydroxy-6-hydroxymethyldihydropteridine diphosphokinase [Magnetococcales bacterium]